MHKAGPTERRGTVRKVLEPEPRRGTLIADPTTVVDDPDMQHGVSDRHVDDDFVGVGVLGDVGQGFTEHGNDHVGNRRWDRGVNRSVEPHARLAGHHLGKFIDYVQQTCPESGWTLTTGLQGKDRRADFLDRGVDLINGTLDFGRDLRKVLDARNHCLERQSDRKSVV